MGHENIPEVAGAPTLNQLVRDCNSLTKRWENTIADLEKKKNASLLLAGLDKTPGANFQHVLLGMFVSAMSDSDLSSDELKKMISAKDEAPFFEIKVTKKIEKFENLIESLPAWIKEYPEAIKGSAKLGPDLA